MVRGADQAEGGPLPQVACRPEAIQRQGHDACGVEWWTTLAYSVFVFCGPRGKDLSFLRVGSLDEDSDVDTSRAGAREEEKKAKIQEASEKESPTASTSLTRDQGRAALASSMDAQNRTQMLKLLIAHGDPAQKAAALLQLAAAVMPAPPVATRGYPCVFRPIPQR